MSSLMRTHGRLGAASALKTLGCGVGWVFALLVMVESPMFGLRPATAADDPRDRDYLATIVNRVLETERIGVEIPWSNTETGNKGVIVIERTYYRPPDDTPCREYRRTLETPSGPEVVKGTGCRIDAGLWELEEQGEPPSSTPGAPPATAGGGGAGTPAPPAAATSTEPPAPSAAAPPPSCPAIDPKQVVRVPCSRPPAFTDYTMPTKAKL